MKTLYAVRKKFVTFCIIAVQMFFTQMFKYGLQTLKLYTVQSTYSKVYVLQNVFGTDQKVSFYKKEKNCL